MKNVILLSGSLVFYAYGEPAFVFVMLSSILMNYIFGLSYCMAMLGYYGMPFFADGKVIYVEGYIKQPEALTTDNRIFAYLPEGYRPKSYWWRPTVHEYKEGMVPLRVNLDGKMYITSINANIQTITNHSLPICLTIPI